MIQFIFFGRLDKEKWIEIILEMLEIMINSKPNILKKCQFIFCWEWEFKDKLLALGNKSDNIHYFWRCEKDKLKQLILWSDFALMPSIFLETFGLSALEALSMWIPVIWFAKWWLEKFIKPSLDIDKQKWTSYWEKLLNIIQTIVENYNEETKFKNHNWCITLAKNFSSKKRMENFKNLTKNQNIKNILLISDYKTKYWWIETYLYKIQSLLNQNWYNCQIRWSNFWKWIIGKILKKIWFWLSIFNFFAAISIYKKIKQTKSDLIRRNSCLRYVWRFPIKYIWKRYNWPKWMMYHDFGYFFAYPSKLYSESQILERNYKNFVKSAIQAKQKSKSFLEFNSKKNIGSGIFFKILNQINKAITWIFSRWKFFFILNPLKKQLKKYIDLHLVPSSFMVKYLENLYWIPKQKIKVFPHSLEKDFEILLDEKNFTKITNNNEKN